VASLINWKRNCGDAPVRRILTTTPWTYGRSSIDSGAGGNLGGLLVLSEHSTQMRPTSLPR
jgi:hypothetical protein